MLTGQGPAFSEGEGRHIGKRSSFIAADISAAVCYNVNRKLLEGETLLIARIRTTLGLQWYMDSR